MKDRKKANQVRINIGVGYFVTAKVEEMANTREGEIISIRKDLVGCVQETKKIT